MSFVSIIPRRASGYWPGSNGTENAARPDPTPEITREIYLHAIPEEQRRAVESVERLVFGPKWTQVQAPRRRTQR